MLSRGGSGGEVRKQIVGIAAAVAGVIAVSAALRMSRPAAGDSARPAEAKEQTEQVAGGTRVRTFTGSAVARPVATPEPIRRASRERNTTSSHSLSGHVSLLGGGALANATVAVNFNTTTTTDADGNYQFTDISRGIWGVSASHPDAITSSVRGLARGQETLDFVLRPKSPVKFVAKVFDAVTRDPVKTYNVIARDRDVVKDPSAAEKFEITKVFTGDQLLFRIEAPNTVTREVREWIPSDATGTISREYAIGNGGTVKGRVVRGSTKLPVAGVRVAMRSFGGGGSPGFGGGGRGRRRDEPTSATTDAQGKFVLQRLNPGPVILQLEPEKPLLTAMRFAGDLQHNELKDVGDLEVGEGGTIKGRVVRLPGATTMDGVRVELAVRDYARMMNGGNDTAAATTSGTEGASQDGRRRGEDRQTSAAVTDAKGNFTFTNVPPGPQSLSIRNYAVRDTVSITAEETQNVVLRVGSGELAGTVLKDGEPVDAARVSMNRGSGGFPGGFGRGGGQNDATTDPDGKFTIKDLIPGKWQLSVRGGRNERSASFDVEIPSEGKLEKTFNMPSGDVVGKVVDAQAQPVAGASVSVMANSDSNTGGGFIGGGGGFRGGRGGGGGVQSADDGTFRLPDRPPGPITLVAYKQDLGYSDPAEGEVPEQGDSEEIVVRMNSGGTGTLVSTAYNVDTGGPIANAYLTLSSPKGRIPQNQRRGEDGVLTVTGLPAGAYTVEVGAMGYTTSQQSVEIKPGETTEISDVLSPGGSLRLNIMDTDGNPIGNAACVLSPQDSSSIETPKQGTTSESGTWMVRGVLPGSYTLTVTTADGKSYTKTITINAGGFANETAVPQ